jgi:hypothetical protein
LRAALAYRTLLVVAGTPAEVFLTPEQLVSRWARAVSEKTLRNWRCLGIGPTFVMIGLKPRYPLSILVVWERRQRRSSGNARYKRLREVLATRSRAGEPPLPRAS